MQSDVEHLRAEGEQRRHGHGCGQSSRQASSTLVAAGLEDRTTGSSAHPRTKSVLAVAAAIVGLECTLHDGLFRTFRITVRTTRCNLPANGADDRHRGLTRQCYGAIGSTPNHERTWLTSLDRPGCSPRRGVCTNDTHVVCPNREFDCVTPAYGVRPAVFSFCWEHARFSRSPQVEGDFHTMWTTVWTICF
jgi:hypothetical protein